MLRDLLINDYNIKKMSVKDSTEFNVKRLLNNNNLNQSQSIIFGSIFEDFIKNIIKNSGYELIYEKLTDVYKTGSKTNKDKKDLDICFVKNNTIYYFESKINLNLDSEKSKATDNKILEITNYLINENINFNIYSGLITAWWEKEEGLQIKTKTNIIYMKDFLELLNIKYTKDEYYTLMNDFGKII